MVGDIGFLTAHGSAENVVLSFFWLFPSGTVIFEEKIPFFPSNDNGWRSRTSADGRPLLFLETKFMVTIGTMDMITK